MVTKAEEVVNKAEQTPLPGAEAGGEQPPESQQPVGPTVEQLQAEMRAMEAKYNKEVGDKDRGNARLAAEIKSLTERLIKAEKSTEGLARQTLAGGEQEVPEETPFQKWQREHGEAAKPGNEPPPLTPAERDWLTEMNVGLASIGLTVENFAISMPEIASQADAAWQQGKYGEANRIIQKAVADKKQGQAPPPVKTEVKVPVDRTAPQGGGSRKAITPQEIKEMSLEEFGKQHADLLIAQREGRIK